MARLRATVICLLAMAVVSSGLWAPVTGAGAGERGASGRTADSDNSFATANAASSGTLYNGSVNSTDDVNDYYSISVLSGQTIKAMIDFTNVSRDLVVEIYDPGQNFITGGYLGFPTRGDNFIAVTNGTYYVDVAIQGAGQDDYSLTITVAYPPTLNHGDTVNASVNASSYNRIFWYRTWLDGNVSGSGKCDAVIVNMTEGSGVTNYNLAMVDILNFAAMNTINMSYSHSPSESVGGAASYTGWYYIIVYGQPGGGAGNVSFTVQKFQANSDGNNDYLNATAAKHNAVVTAHVDQGVDHYDWYRYHVFADDTLRVKVDRTTGGDVFLLAVFDDDMNQLDITNNIDPLSGSVLASAALDIPAASSDMYYRIFVGADTAVSGGSPSDNTAAFDYKITFTSTDHVPSVQSSLPDVNIDEDTGYFFNLSSHYSDMDGDTVKFNFTGLTNIQATYTEENGTLAIVPKANWFGSEKLTVQADDWFGGSVLLTSNITVKSVNDLPYVKASIKDVKMLQGGSDSSIDLSKVFADADVGSPANDKLTYAVLDNGSIWVDIQANGAVRLTAPKTFFGPQTMNFTATDMAEATATAVCNVMVTHVNQPPNIGQRPANISINEDEQATIDFTTVFIDPEGDPITITPSDMTRINVVVDPNTRKATLKPLKDMSGFYEDIKFTAQDDLGAQGDFVVIRVTVVPVNDAPVFKTVQPSGDVTLIEMQTQDFTGSATDIDDTTLNYTWYLDGKDLHVSETTYTYATTYESAGNHTVKVVVDDGELEISRVWNVTVINLNRPPSEVKIVSPRTGESFAQSAEIEFEGSAKDLDKETLTYTWLDGRTTISEEKTFTTAALKPGSHTITLEVSDGTETVKAPKNIIITVIANSAPQILGYTPASGTKFTTGQKIVFTVNIRNEEATDNLTFVWSENNGATVLSNTQTFETSALKAGLHMIKVQISDGFNTVNGSITVEVANPAPAPGMNMRTLGIMIGVVAAVAVVGGLAFVMMRRRKPPAPSPEPQAGPVLPPAAGSTVQAPPYQPYAAGYQPASPPPAPDYGYQQPPAQQGYAGAPQAPQQPEAGAYQAPQSYDNAPYQPSTQGEPGVPPAEAYQQQPAWAMAPPSQPGGGDTVRQAAYPGETQPPVPREPQQPQ